MSNCFLQKQSNVTFSLTFPVLTMHTCTPEWRTSFLREATPALSNVPIDIGVIWEQGKTTETRKIAISTVKQTHTHTNQITFEEKTFYINSTEMYVIYGIYMPPRIDNLSEQRTCHNMSYIHTAWGLFCQILIGQFTTVLTNQKARTQKKGLIFTGALNFCCTLLVKTCCQNNAVESHKSVISLVIKIRGIATFDINVHFCWGLMRDSVTIHRTKRNRKVWKKFHNLMHGAPWFMRFNFQGVHPGFRNLKFRVHPEQFYNLDVS